MIDLYFMTSPNVYKVVIALEEIGLDYRLIPTNITDRSKLLPSALGGAPNGKLPVIVDHGSGLDSATMVFESGAILQYLAERHDMLLPTGFKARIEVMQWLFWQVGGLGPFGGQCFHFRAIAPAIAPHVDNAYARNRYAHILTELWEVAEAQLATRQYLAGEYSIADIACYPWIEYLAPLEGRDRFPHLEAWRSSIKQRPAVRRAYQRARDVEMGYPRDALDTVVLPLDDVRKAITL